MHFTINFNLHDLYDNSVWFIYLWFNKIILYFILFLNVLLYQHVQWSNDSSLPNLAFKPNDLFYCVINISVFTFNCEFLILVLLFILLFICVWIVWYFPSSLSFVNLLRFACNNSSTIWDVHFIFIIYTITTLELYPIGIIGFGLWLRLRCWHRRIIRITGGKKMRR